jgi:hypothetical protein
LLQEQLGFPIVQPSCHNLPNWKEVARLLESCNCVVAYISGRKHEGNYAANKGIYYLTLQGMINKPDQDANVVVEVHEDRLEVCGVGGVPSLTLVIRQGSKTSH